MNRLPLLTFLAVAVGLLSWPRLCPAAVISELFISDGTAEGVPNAIEFADLDALPASAVDLIVIDVSPRRYGAVERVISLPTDWPYQLLSERSWPSQPWGDELELGPSAATLDTLGEGDSLAFAGARSLLLYDRTTTVTETGGLSLFSDDQQARLNGAALLDQMTITLDGAAVSEQVTAPILALSAGHAVVRPLDGSTFSSDLLAGPVTATGTLAGVSPEVTLTPGAINIDLSPVPATPEPATASLLAAALAVLLARRPRRRCSAGSGRL